MGDFGIAKADLQGMACQVICMGFVCWCVFQSGVGLYNCSGKDANWYAWIPQSLHS